MDRRTLGQWLRAGFMEKQRLFPTTAGTPQGGIASPALANLTLDGLEPAIRAAIKPRHDQVNFIRYADDFVVTARSKETLEQKVKPVIVEFLQERGLKLSEEKTLITHIAEGFNFLGQRVRKYGNKLLIRPTQPSARRVLDKARELIRSCRGLSAATVRANLDRTNVLLASSIIRAPAFSAALKPASEPFRVSPLGPPDRISHQL